MSNNPEKLHDAHILAKHPLPAAGLLGLATLPIHAVLPHDWSVSLAAFILALIGGVYIGFAVLDGRLSRLLMETTVAVAFAVYAAVTFHNAPLWIAFGYILHGL